MTLTEFLTARIAEDELQTQGMAEDIGQWMGDRWVAECEAKRRIVELHMAHEERVAFALSADLSPDHADQRRKATHEVLRALALPYADHPDYRDEWRT
jgi:hypothetical protein